MSNYVKKTWVNGVDACNQTNMNNIENGIAAVPGLYVLTTPYQFASGVSMGSGATNSYQITGNGTPTIPSNASFALVSVQYTANGQALLQAGPNGFSAANISSYPLLGGGQVAGSNLINACGIVPLNTSNGKLDFKTPNGNITGLNASVYGYVV